MVQKVLDEDFGLVVGQVACHVKVAWVDDDDDWIPKRSQQRADSTPRSQRRRPEM